MLSEDNEVYSCIDITSIPSQYNNLEKVPMLDNIKRMTVNGYGSLALSDNGEVYGVADFSTVDMTEGLRFVSFLIKSQLSDDDSIPLTSRTVRGTHNITRSASIINGLNNIVQLSMNDDIIIVLDNNRNLYRYIFLDQSCPQFDGKFNKLECDIDINIISLSKYKNTCITTNFGLYSISDHRFEDYGIKGIIQTSGGEKHILILTLEGYVYGYGSNFYGQLAN